ncbi:MAG: response regulator transcription factor [Oscillospiraceae bacterium]|jgi:DNA-binding response OmpR family regulator|nr:response regulator transcription factor [Oscillospiraceae bacterium]
MEKPQRILIVHPDNAVRDKLQFALINAGFAAFGAADFDDGLSKAAEYRPALAFVADGAASFRGSANIFVVAMNAGAAGDTDDFLLPPFRPEEAVLRAKALLKSQTTEEEHESVSLLVSYDGLVVDKSKYELRVDGTSISTPPRELELLYHLAANPNRVFTRNQLLDDLWGFEYFGDTRTVDVHVRRLRKKLGSNPDRRWELKTVWGIGYKFSTE